MKLILLIILMAFSALVSVRGQHLDLYFSIAAENNPGLQAKYKAFEAAMEKVAQKSTLPDPTLSIGYFISPVETRVGPQRARFSINQMFPWFGTLKTRGDVEALLAEARFQSFLDARNQLYYEVTLAYYPLYKLKQWKKIEAENLTILKSFKSMAHARFENGEGSMVDVLRVDMMLEEIAAELIILDKNEKSLLARFNTLLNREIDKDLEGVSIPDIGSLSDHYRRDSLLVDNPKLQELELKMKAMETAERLARKQGLPNLGLGLDYVIVDERPDLMLPENGKNVLMPMVSVSIPIFREKYKSAVNEARLLQEGFVLQQQEYTNALHASYEDALFQLRQHYELLALYETQLRLAQQALELLLTAYSNSGNEFEEVLRMQQQMLKYRKLIATAEVELLMARAKIDYLTAK